MADAATSELTVDNILDSVLQQPFVVLIRFSRLIDARPRSGENASARTKAQMRSCQTCTRQHDEPLRSD